MYTAGIDVGSTYTKAVILKDGAEVMTHAMKSTGFKLGEASQDVYDQTLAEAGIKAEDVSYVVATGFGRHQVGFADASVTDLTASARGTRFYFPGTRTILDVGGQTMKATRIDEDSKVKSFRLNDKCAAGTGAFLEKTARYMGYETTEIGPLVTTSKDAAAISGVCAVFAESEVINHLSMGTAPSDIMYGAISSLVDRSVQLMRRVRLEPEFTLIGGILRFERMGEVIRENLQTDVNVPEGDMVQFVNALGAAVLAAQRHQELEQAASV